MIFDNDTYLIRSQFYYTALKNGWVLGENYGYYKGCYNYAVPEVREKMLSYIREQVTRYDVYGLELDFVREIQCFPHMTADRVECTRIMNGFIRQVKAIVREAEAVHGHPVKIAIRVGRDMTHTLHYGLDPVYWAKEKLFDVLREAGNELSQPVELLTTGGGSDGNWTANLGVATLDGCGPCGANLHTKNEYLKTESIAPRLYIMELLLKKLF